MSIILGTRFLDSRDGPSHRKLKLLVPKMIQHLGYEVTNSGYILGKKQSLCRSVLKIDSYEGLSLRFSSNVLHTSSWKLSKLSSGSKIIRIRAGVKKLWPIQWAHIILTRIRRSNRPWRSVKGSIGHWMATNKASNEAKLKSRSVLSLSSFKGSYKEDRKKQEVAGEEASKPIMKLIQSWM